MLLHRLETSSHCGFLESLKQPLYHPHKSTINPCFIASVDLIVFTTCGLFLLYQLLQLIFNNRFGPYKIKYSFGNPIKLKSVGILQLIKLNSVFIQFVLLLVLTSFNNTGIRNASLVSWTLYLDVITTGLVVIPFMVIEPTRAAISSASLLFYWTAKILFNLIIYLQDLFSSKKLFIGPNDSLSTISIIHVIEIGLLINSLLIFIFELCFYQPSVELVDYYDINEWKINSLHNFYSEIVFYWIETTINKVNEKGSIKVEDVEPPHISLTNDVCYQEFMNNWEPAYEKAKSERDEKLKSIPNPTDKDKEISKISLFRIILKMNWIKLLTALTFDLTEIVFSIAQTFLLQRFIEYFTIQQEDGHPSQPRIVGFTIATGIFATSLLRFTTFNRYFVSCFLVRFSIYSQLMSFLYRKSLRLSPAARKGKTSGEIVNNLSTDVFDVGQAPEALIELLSVPIRLAMSLIALTKIIGYSTWVGVITGLIMIPILTLITTSIQNLYEKNMELKDSRVRLTSEILTSIKSIKLFAWELPLLKRLFHIRNDQELALARKIGIFNAVSLLFWKSVPFVISCSCLIAFNYFGSVPIIPSIAFPALSLFQIMTEPLLMLPYVFSGLVQCNVSLKRLRELFTMEEVEGEIVKRTNVSAVKDEATVILKNATFVWDHDAELTADSTPEGDHPSNVALTDINFTAKKGQLTCIVGKVGSGKSTLIKALLGTLSLKKNNETIALVNGSIAYCAQDPWITNATVKENILFGCKLNKSFYLKTIEACQLVKDFDVLPDGDRTVVGEKGISLSGGQKARVALARAVYSRADVIFLDDVLSAVDAHVCKKIIKNVLAPGGLLSSKTVVLATNAVSVLEFAHEIVMLKEGMVVERGSFDEVVANGAYLAKLIDEFGKKDEKNTDINDEIASESTSTALTPTATESMNEVVDFVPSDTGNTELDLELCKINTNDTRKASMASFLYNYEDDEDDMIKKTNLLEEKGAQGSVKWSVYMEYFKACNYSYLSLYLVCEFFSVFGDLLANYILKSWSEKNLELGGNVTPLLYLGLYCASGIAAAIFALTGTVIVWVYCSINGSIYFHEKMANSVTRSPMSFFETTPVGRILNRFSEDINVIDSQIIWSLLGLVSYGIEAIGYLVVVVVNLPFMFFVIIGLFFVYNSVRKHYISASRELKRLNSAQKSPIFSHLQESVSGVDTIFAYDQEKRFIHKNTDLVDKYIKVTWSNNICNRWLSMRLQLISAIIIYATTVSIWGAEGTKGQLTPGLVGFVMINAMGVTGTLNAIIRYYANCEVQSVAVERVIEYCNLPPEAEPIIENNRPPSNWPSQGAIKFENFTTKYREELDPILKNIKLEIKRGEKIGIVGRTGAGKSTLSISIFRLIEATSGHICIDGVNTSEIGLYDLRHNLNIIPQDANAVEGTVRQNLDPFQQYSDEKLWKVLELAHLKEHVSKMKTKKETSKDAKKDTKKDTKKDKNIEDELATNEENISSDDLSEYDVGLSAKIFEGGSNLSSGQRQLMSLSRSLLNPSKILILDEATAAVDVETDKIIQQTIRNEFKDKTILTIAHRLGTVLDSDKILVLDKGEVKEYDSPKNLLSDPSSEFYSLCSEGGHLQNINIEDLK